MDVTLDKFGRIVIPKKVRDALGLQAGSKLHLKTVQTESGEQAVSLQTERDRPTLVWKDNVLVHTGKIIDEGHDIVEFIKEEREKRSRKLGGL